MYWLFSVMEALTLSSEAGIQCLWMALSSLHIKKVALHTSDSCCDKKDPFAVQFYIHVLGKNDSLVQH